MMFFSLFRGFSGCIGTFKWDGMNLPLNLASSNDNKQKGGVSIKSSMGVKDGEYLSEMNESDKHLAGCSLRVTCDQLPPNYCPSILTCLDTWKGAVCTCPQAAPVTLSENGEVRHSPH